MEGSRQSGEMSNEEKSVAHRRYFETGQLSEPMMTGVALEALERADVQLFLDVTNVTRQSDDPEIVARTGLMLNTYADMAAGIVRDEDGAPIQQPTT
jgi:hypothetical protein